MNSSVPEHLLLEGGEAAIHVEGGLVGVGDGVELDELPFHKALRLLDGREGIAGKLGSAIRTGTEEFTVFTLQHGADAFRIPESSLRRRNEGMLRRKAIHRQGPAPTHRARIRDSGTFCRFFLVVGTDI